MQGGGISKLSPASSVFSGDVFSILTSAILDILLWTLCKAHVTYPSKKDGRETAREAEALLSNPKYPFRQVVTWQPTQSGFLRTKQLRPRG